MRDLDEGIPALALAYIGGLFDARGFARVHEYGKSQYALLYIQLNTELEATFVTNAFEVGGIVRSNETKIRYAVNGKKAIEVMKHLKPYVIGKRHQIEEVLQWHFNKTREPSVQG